MLPASAAALFLLINLAIAGVIGLPLGFASSRVLRLPWNASAAILDLVIAVWCGGAVSIPLAEISLSRNTAQPEVQWIFAAAALGVVLRQRYAGQGGILLETGDRGVPSAKRVSGSAGA